MNDGEKLLMQKSFGLNPVIAKLCRQVTLKPFKLQQYTLHFWKPQVFFYLEKKGQKRICSYRPLLLIGMTLGLFIKSQTAVSLSYPCMLDSTSMHYC